ncbi:LacI family DNA-binding transcriptional regulator [Paenibacillus mendelii]|uniref:LacI family DNA-binding transcriptional regulator n=1 Tax=Paenibacillus mendelii TaxID=206163 RepID=A0ABV6J3Q7_9BACL|nr:LacI family DNA-binding transcriptional regulator [Paenibacillus mendelii]MCQ6561978.1 LacI family transcriptional regulator [Paenibacillus mendelii]
MKPTIYNVASKAGVSIATVSKVLNKTGRISEGTRRRVVEVMEEMGYQPSVIASALTGKSTFTIGMLIPDLANPFFAEVARSAEDRGHELGFNLVMCSTDNDPAKEVDYISLLKQKSVDGIILSTVTTNHSTVKDILKLNIPVALIARDMPTLAVDTVIVDDFIGGYLAAEHLIELGHRRIAVIAEDMNVMSSSERVRGYRSALEENGLEYDDALVKESDFTIQGGKLKSGELLDSIHSPTAIFACNDLLAIGAIQAARERGMQLPRDLSVVGFDNTILASIVEPPLTTVAQPMRDMGRHVIDLLIQEIRGLKNQKQRIILVPELVVRGSTSKRVHTGNQ